MIVELFYPRELKQIIQDLEAQGNLRGEPLRRMDSFYKMLGFPLGVLLVLALLNDIYAFLFFAVISILLLFTLIKINTRAYLAYAYGELTEGIVEKIICVGLHSRVIKIRKSPDGKALKSILLDDKIIDFKKLEKSRKIKFYYSDKHASYAMPDLSEIKFYYCLRKDLMQEDV